MLLRLQAMVRDHPEMHRAEQDDRSARKNQGIHRDFKMYLAYIKEVAARVDARAKALHPKSFQRRANMETVDYFDIDAFNAMYEQGGISANKHDMEQGSFEQDDMVPVLGSNGELLCYRMVGNRRTIAPDIWQQLEPGARKAIQLGRPLLDNEGRPPDAKPTAKLDSKPASRQTNNHSVAFDLPPNEGEDSAPSGTPTEQDPSTQEQDTEDGNVGNLYALLHDAYVKRSRKSA